MTALHCASPVSSQRLHILSHHTHDSLSIHSDNSPQDGADRAALWATLTLLYLMGAAHQGTGGKRAWTKNKLEELRRRSPGRDRDSAAHHAKPGPNANMGNQKEKRRLVTFIGGIDMCDGRYDTPRHSLFHTLATVHTEDFHQACITGADIKKGGEQAQLLSATAGSAVEDRKLCSAAEGLAFGHRQLQVFALIVMLPGDLTEWVDTSPSAVTAEVGVAVVFSAFTSAVITVLKCSWVLGSSCKSKVLYSLHQSSACPLPLPMS